MTKEFPGGYFNIRNQPIIAVKVHILSKPSSSIATFSVVSTTPNRTSQIARFIRPTKGPPWSYRPQVGLMLAPWTLLSGMSSWRTSLEFEIGTLSLLNWHFQVMSWKSHRNTFPMEEIYGYSILKCVVLTWNDPIEYSNDSHDRWNFIKWFYNFRQIKLELNFEMIL